MTWKAESGGSFVSTFILHIAVFACRPARTSVTATISGVVRDSFNEIGDVPLGTYYGSPVPPEFMTPFVDRGTGNIEGQRFPVPLRRQYFGGCYEIEHQDLPSLCPRRNRHPLSLDLPGGHHWLHLGSDYRPERRGDSRSDRNGYRDLDQYSAHRRHGLQGVLFLSGVPLLEVGGEAL
jgi:hypothetical protein